MKFPTAVVTAALAVALGFTLGHKSTSPSIPTIVTKYDTVTVTEFKRDTQFIVKLKTDTVYKVNVVERVITAPPETIHVFHALSGITGVNAGQKFGDTTKVVSFKLAEKDTTPVATFLLTKNLYTYYTPGPVQAVFLTDSGTPHVTFGDKFPVCHPLQNAAEGAGAIILLRLILSH